MDSEIRSFTFGKGAHASREDGMCVMEAVAFLNNEPHSDSPKCADPVITRLAIWLNDSCDDARRQELCAELPWRIVGTKATTEVEQRRAFMAADWAVRTVAPRLLRRAGLEGEAAKLESLPEISDTESARAVARAARAAADAAADAAAYAARAAADAAAYAARDAAYAARAAADAAARDAADAAYAARAARAAAARDAAYAADAAARAAADAARDAAYAAADLEWLQRDCARVLDRMIRLTEPQEKYVESCRRKEAGESRLYAGEIYGQGLNH